ncbi:PilZ domain-containing protein [Niveispirillum fermenti]|uniref:PilZ domain-containing protein n=1 Tax=Niveispirillum fermenti TaxID=1233113 RepID=UPI003A85D80E
MKEPVQGTGGDGPEPDEALNAKLLACWQAALNTDDPQESQRWVEMAEWLARRGGGLPPVAGGGVLPAGRDGAPASGTPAAGPGPDRRRFPRVPLRSPALLSLGDRVMRGETVNLSRTGACFACVGPVGLSLGDTGSFSVRGWVEDRPARIVGLEPGQIRLAFG